MAKLKIVEMDHIVLNVSDVERSLAFYTETLGLEGERLEEFLPEGWLSVRQNLRAHADRLGAGSSAPLADRNLNHFCLVSESTDLGELPSELKTKGVVVVQEPVSRWGARGQATSIYIQDPDENEIEIRCH